MSPLRRSSNIYIFIYQEIYTSNRKILLKKYALIKEKHALIKGQKKYLNSKTLIKQ